MPQELFSDDNKEGTPPVVASPVDQNPLLTKLQEIKNEDGQPKYDSLEKAIEALAHSQQFIPQIKTEKERLEAELAEAKKQLEASESVEDVVNKLLQQNQKPEPEPKTLEEPKGLDEEGVAAIVRKEQERLANQAKADANAKKVTDALTEKYGDKAKEEVAKKAVELGMTVEKLGQLAIDAPDAVLALFTTGGKTPPAPSSSDVNTSMFNKTPSKDIERPKKSLLSGASSKEQAEFMRQIKEAVHKKYDVET